MHCQGVASCTHCICLTGCGATREGGRRASSAAARDAGYGPRSEGSCKGCLEKKRKEEGQVAAALEAGGLSSSKSAKCCALSGQPKRKKQTDERTRSKKKNVPTSRRLSHAGTRRLGCAQLQRRFRNVCACRRLRLSKPCVTRRRSSAQSREAVKLDAPTSAVTHSDLCVWRGSCCRGISSKLLPRP